MIVGIDPGLDGGIGWIDGDKTGAMVMPTLDKAPDLRAIAERLRELAPKIVVIERAQTRAAQSANSGLTTGINYGYLIGWLTGVGIPFKEVHPATWKAKMGIALRGKDFTPKQKKDKAIAECRRLFPRVLLLASPKCRVDHDGMAEALLLAEYGRRERLI
jgi:hypothetical protein